MHFTRFGLQASVRETLFVQAYSHLHLQTQCTMWKFLFAYKNFI